MATKLGQTISYDNDDLHRGQRSTEVKCVNLCYMVWSDIPLIQGKDHDVLHEGHPKVIKGQIVNQMLTEVKCSKVFLGLKHHRAIKMVMALKLMLPPNLARALAKGTVISCFFFRTGVCLFVCLFFPTSARKINSGLTHVWGGGLHGRTSVKSD